MYTNEFLSSQMIIARNYPGGSRKYYADVLHKLIEENMYVDFIYIFIMRGRGGNVGYRLSNNY